MKTLTLFQAVGMLLLVAAGWAWAAAIEPVGFRVP